VLCTKYFDIVNRLCVYHQCDIWRDIRTGRQSDGQNCDSSNNAR